MSRPPNANLLVHSLSSYDHGPVVRMLVVSFSVHVLLLALGLGLRISTAHERPLASYEVTLVSMSAVSPPAERRPEVPVTPVTRPPVPAEPVLIPPKVEPAPIRPAAPVMPALQPKQRMQAVPVPKRQQSAREREPVKVDPSLPPPRRSVPTPKEPASASVLSEPPARKQQVEEQLKSALGEIEQPPKAPDLRSHRPVERRAPSPETPPRDLNVQKALKTLPEVPDLSTPAAPEPKSKREVTTKSRIAEDVAKQLSELERPTPEEESSKDLTVASKSPSLRKPLTNIKVPGAGTGLNKYLAVMKAKITRRWVPPRVGLRDPSLQVVVQFRLHRDGHVTDVAIKRSSGNEYYDDAGKRAVQAADPLPSFPAHMDEKVLDVHFSFTVGNGAG